MQAQKIFKDKLQEIVDLTKQEDAYMWVDTEFKIKVKELQEAAEILRIDVLRSNVPAPAFLGTPEPESEPAEEVKEVVPEPVVEQVKEVVEPAAETPVEAKTKAKKAKAAEVPAEPPVNN